MILYGRFLKNNASFLTILCAICYHLNLKPFLIYFKIWRFKHYIKISTLIIKRIEI